MIPSDFATHKEWVRYLEDIEREYSRDTFTLSVPRGDDEYGLAYFHALGILNSTHTSHPMFEIKQDHMSERYHEACLLCNTLSYYSTEQTFWDEYEDECEWQRTWWFKNAMDTNHHVGGSELPENPPTDHDWIARTPHP